MGRILVAEFLILFIILEAAIAPSHQHTTQGDALRLWRRGRRYKSHSLQTTEWGFDNALMSFRNDFESIDVQQQEADYLPHGLPGQPTGIEFRQYSGYVTVDAKAGRALFYYFTEAVRDSSKQPLVLWLNGGPGCSSLGFGAMAELGPFRVNPDGKTLHFNSYAWNQVANMLFLESPAGVGYSYSNTSSDYAENGDRRTARDAYVFLVKWFNRFPQYKFRDFYIAGESYAGNYIPELAATILQHQRLSKASFINFKGIMVGNGIMNSDTDNIGGITYPWTHALISDQTYEGLIGNCLKSNADEILCNNLADSMETEMGNINQYNIYAPLCLTNSSKLAKQEEAEIPGYDPCSDDYVFTYFNTPDVQKAIHANVTNLNYTWNQCSNVISNWTDYASTVLPIYRHLIATGLRILLYSGDTDTVVPVTSTRLSINELKLPIETPWYPWLNGDEVGGYTVIYKGLTFATVRGAGHEVPEYQPSRALTLFKSFLAGKPLPS